MCQLFQACRLCFNMTGIRYSHRPAIFLLRSPMRVPRRRLRERTFLSGCINDLVAHARIHTRFVPAVLGYVDFNPRTTLKRRGRLRDMSQWVQNEKDLHPRDFLGPSGDGRILSCGDPMQLTTRDHLVTQLPCPLYRVRALQSADHCPAGDVAKLSPPSTARVSKRHAPRSSTE
jgi:hypothetical protein